MKKFILTLIIVSIMLSCLSVFAEQLNADIVQIKNDAICESVKIESGITIETKYNLQDNQLSKDLYLVDGNKSKLIKEGVNSFYCNDDLYYSYDDKLDKYSINTGEIFNILSGVVLRNITISNKNLYAIDDANGLSQLIITTLDNPKVIYTNYTNVNSFKIKPDRLEIDMRISEEQLDLMDTTTLYINDSIATNNAKTISNAQDGLDNLLNTKDEISLMSINENTDDILLNSIVSLSSIQPAMFVMDTLYVTQGAYSSSSHSDDNAFDLDGSLGGGKYDCANVYAPFDGTVKYRETSYNAVWVESDSIVQYANGSTGYMTVLFMHDMDISNIYNGQHLTQREVFYNEGGKGPQGQTQYATHLHIECMNGQVGSKGWKARGNVYPNDALYLYPSTNISNKGGYNWRTWTGAISPSDTEPPTITNAYVSELSGSSFNINCTLNDNVGVTRVWLNIYGPGGSNGYEVSASNGNFYHTINTSDYGGAGYYDIHIYAFDAAGNESQCVQLFNINAVSDVDAPSISNAYISDINSNSFKLNCTLNDNIGVTRVWIEIYGPGGSSDGYNLSASNGNFTHTINTSNYGGSGTYSVRITAFDEKNNSTSWHEDTILCYDIVNLGDDFKAYIEHATSYNILTKNTDNNIIGAPQAGASTQIWHFYRLGDGSYTIASVSDYSYMEMEDSSADGGINISAKPYTGNERQRFFIYYINGYYYIKPVYTKYHLDFNSSTSNIELWTGVANWDPQKFNIKIVDNCGYLPINLGNDFKAYIEHQSSHNVITKTDSNIIAAPQTGESTQMWHFYRLNDGSYTIANVSDYSYMEMDTSNMSEGGINIFPGAYTGNENQRFFIYEMGGAYCIKPIYTRFNFDRNNNNIELWHEVFDWDSQKFNINIIDNCGYLPTNLGSDFKAYIRHKKSGKLITKSDANIIAEPPTGDTTQVWRFFRLVDGSYTIANISDYSYMEVETSNPVNATNIIPSEYTASENQRFFIYEINSAYCIKPIYTRYNVDKNSRDNIELWYEALDWTPQQFDIKKIDNLIIEPTEKPDLASSKMIELVGKYKDNIAIEMNILDDWMSFVTTEVNGSDLPEIITVYIALYDEYGNMIGVDMRQFNSDDNYCCFYADIPEEGNYKVMIWDENNSPIIKALTQLPENSGGR